MQKYNKKIGEKLIENKNNSISTQLTMKATANKTQTKSQNQRHQRDDKLTSQGARMMYLEDETLDPDDSEILAFVPNTVQLSANRGSRIYVVGRARNREYPEGSGIEKTTISVFGVYPLMVYEDTPEEEIEEAKLIRWDSERE